MLKVADLHVQTVEYRSDVTGGLMTKFLSRLCFVVLASVAGFSAAALAQALSAEQRAACQADYNKYCKGTMPGGGRIIACLKQAARPDQRCLQESPRRAEVRRFWC